MVTETTRNIKCPTCGAEPGKTCVSVKSGKPLSDNHAARNLSRKDPSLISINQAVRNGIERLCKPIWTNKFDHIKIDIIDGKLGPWIHLYAPFNKECNGRDPVDVLWLVQPWNLDYQEFEAYRGPLPDSDEYKREVAKFEGVLSDVQ